MEQFIGSLTFGSIFTAESIREMAGITMPTTGTYKEFQEAELKELQVIGAIRDLLLNKGMYLKREGENYRVLLPSENADQIKRMNASASRKYKRALLLEKNTPKQAEAHRKITSTASRIRDIANREKLQRIYA